MDFKKIEKLRIDKKLTQKELADQIEMTVTGYQSAIKKNDFKYSTLEKIASALGVSINSLLSGGKLDINSQIFIGDNNQLTAESCKELQSKNNVLSERIKGLETENELLKKVIKMLEKKQ